MVQAPNEEMVALPWDAFVAREIDNLPIPDERRLDLAESAREHIDAFRELEWPNIKIQLRSEPYSINIPDNLEPHWVSAGKAVWWQRQVIRQRVERTDSEGRIYQTLEDVDYGWQPTNAGLPTLNASQIAAYLQKGLRLRPPLFGVDDERLKSAVPSEALQAAYESDDEPELQPEPYIDRRLGAKQRVFHSWESYAKFCASNGLDFEYDIPEYVVEHAQQFTWYCYIHNVGFHSKRMAQQHYRERRRRPASSAHKSLTEMLVTPLHNAQDSTGGKTDV